MERDFSFCKLKAIFRSKRTLNSLFGFKYSLEKKIRSGIIYRYTCSNYKVTCQQTFVGLEDVLKTSSPRLQRNKFSPSKTSWRRVENVLRHLARRLEDVLKRLGRRKIVTLKTPWRRLENVLRHLTRRLEDVLKTSWETKYCYAENDLKTSWRHVLKKSWRHVLKTSSRRLGEKKNRDICIKQI